MSPGGRPSPEGARALLRARVRVAQRGLRAGALLTPGMEGGPCAPAPAAHPADTTRAPPTISGRTQAAAEVAGARARSWDAGAGEGVPQAAGDDQVLTYLEDCYGEGEIGEDGDGEDTNLERPGGGRSGGVGVASDQPPPAGRGAVAGKFAGAGRHVIGELV